MRVEQLGDGDPGIAIVGAIHGDEPCGSRAIERLVQEPPAVDRPVKLIVANERALRRNLRYIDTDLNRAFPGDPHAQAHEAGLAHSLLAELEGTTVLSLHSTQSYAGAFALCGRREPSLDSTIPYLSVDALVETRGFSDGRLIDHEQVIEVECGLQGSDQAAENAMGLCREFLTATGALPRETPVSREVPVYGLEREISKPAGTHHRVLAENFERVARGERFAAVDGTAITAEQAFYPILMSANGYEDVFGYAGELVGRLEHAPD